MVGIIAAIIFVFFYFGPMLEATAEQVFESIPISIAWPIIGTLLIVLVILKAIAGK